MALSLDTLATLVPTFAMDLPEGVSPQGYGRLSINRSGTSLAWGTEWDATREVILIDLARGEVRSRMANIAADHLVRRQGGFFVVDSGYRPDGALEPRLFHLRDDGTSFHAPVSLAGVGWLKSYAPTGDMIAFFHEGKLQVRRFPALDVVATLHGREPGIDWQSGRMWCSLRPGEYDVSSIDGSEPPIRIQSEEALYPACSGVAETSLDEVTLYGLLVPWRAPLVPKTSSTTHSVSIPPERDRVRCVEGRVLRRFVVDWTDGAVRDSEILGALPEEPRIGALIWHPTVDAMVAPAGGRRRLVSLSGETVLEFPAGARPELWFDDGRALLVTYPNDGERLPLEVWRVGADP